MSSPKELMLLVFVNFAEGSFNIIYSLNGKKKKEKRKNIQEHFLIDYSRNNVEANINL